VASSNGMSLVAPVAEDIPESSDNQRADEPPPRSPRCGDAPPADPGERTRKGAPELVIASLHQVLLRVAGWVPDEAVTLARTWCADGRAVDVAELVVHAAVSGRVPMLPEDVRLLESVLLADARDVGYAARIHRVARLGPPCVAFAGDQGAAAGGPDQGEAVDAAVVEAIGRAPSRAVWRAWRLPGTPTPWPPPRRVFLVQVDAEPDRLAGLAARAQAVLEGAGEPAPQVEVFVDADRLPPYQGAALSSATLLWSPAGTGPLTVARVFDPVASTGGPGFGSSRRRIDGAERESVLSFLDSGTRVLASTALMDDVLSDGVHAVVPTGFRTDGTWVWSEATTYYARQHGVAPPVALLAHIRSAGHPAGPVDAAGRHRALAALAAGGPADGGAG
jgi:hypothetical protein